MDQREKLRKAQLYIANEIKRVCERNGIRFFLDCGTLLGAVRHHGFIPWDDDIDIGMLREDYERFLRCAPTELGKEFFLDNYDSDPEYALVFSKVRLKGTKYVEAKGNAQAEHNEIFVDVFPYYDVSDNIARRKWEGFEMAVLSQAIMSRAGYKVWKGDPFPKRLKFISTDLLGSLLSAERMRKTVEDLFGRHRDMRCVCIHDGSMHSYLHWIIPKEYFLELVEASFEGFLFPIPKEYDKYLKIAYGDYMTVPPQEQQSTHMIRELDMGEYSF